VNVTGCCAAPTPHDGFALHAEPGSRRWPIMGAAVRLLHRRSFLKVVHVR